ncbi:hemerythrin domain-containing protein [Rhodanobacter sp. KK11]|uniref:hemerythrin domain-containing protein n=1 Tax=Rhodanobacter sp. KK11 TaxID=3083255 RepID=UPI002966D6A7|nr:hemerythrin domain-containing protein [Rhodanobacter sp. KK11]MDW2983012.1 hemerythrin domain-containing protein [Rhodanobacter sp. KK11]
MHHSSHRSAAAAPAPVRYNMYGFIHKALRAFMADTLLRLGRMDLADAREVDATLQQVRELLQFCRVHLDDENRFVHPALEACEPGSAARIAGEHVHHEEDIALLLEQVDALEQLRVDDAAGEAANNLYRWFALFVGENFQHMDYEEREHNAVLWAHYSDAQLQAIEGALVASLPPQASALGLRWMLPSLNHAERLQLLGGIRANAPDHVFGGALALARAHLDEQDWRKLSAALALPAAQAA